MLFDSHLWGFTFLWVLLAALPTGAIAFLSTGSSNKKSNRRDGEDSKPGTPASTKALIGAIVSGFVMLVLTRWMVYYGQPSLVGVFGGYSPYLFCLAVAFCAGGLLSNVKTVVGGIALAVVTIVSGCVMHFIFGTGLEQARFFADLPKVQVVEGTAMPPTDPKNIMQVPRAVAIYRAGSVLNAGDNLASLYKLNLDELTLKTVGGHLYWVVPLDYNSVWNQIGYFATPSDTTPGFVKVDAENPDATPELVKVPLKYLPDAAFDQNVGRQIYFAGFEHCNIDDTTFEVDDNWHPYYTTACIVPAAGGVSGSKVTQVVTLDAVTGEVKGYEPGKEPAWVSRVYSYDLVKKYAEDYGNYGDHRHNRYWFGNQQFQSKPEDFEIHAAGDGSTVWVIPMVSVNSSTASADGVMVVNTKTGKFTLYRGFNGKTVGDPISHSFMSFPNASVNISKLSIESVQLYTIYGHPTWVAIYTRDMGSKGSAFAGIGFLDAMDPQPDNVQFGTSAEAALTSYRSYLAGSHDGSNDASVGGQSSKPVQGVVARINGAMVNGQWQYTLTIEGDATHLFTINIDKHPELPVVRSGDKVSFSYLDTGHVKESIGDFTDNTPLDK